MKVLPAKYDGRQRPHRAVRELSLYDVMVRRGTLRLAPQRAAESGEERRLLEYWIRCYLVGPDGTPWPRGTEKDVSRVAERPAGAFWEALEAWMEQRLAGLIEEYFGSAVVGSAGFSVIGFACNSGHDAETGAFGIEYRSHGVTSWWTVDFYRAAGGAVVLRFNEEAVRAEPEEERLWWEVMGQAFEWLRALARFELGLRRELEIPQSVQEGAR